MARTPKVPKTDFDHLTDCIDALYTAQIALNRIHLPVIADDDVDVANKVFEVFKTIQSAVTLVSSVRNERA